MDHMSDMTSMDHMHDAHNSQSAHDRNNMPGMNSMHDMNSMNGMHGMSHMDHNHMNHDMTQMTSATKSMMKMHAAMFRRLFWISLVIAIPTVALDPMFASLLHYPVPTTLPWTLIPAALGTVLYFWTGKPFITGGISEIKQKKPGMMLLILLGITVAFVASWLSTLGLIKTPTFWWELALLIVIMLAGHWIEMGSVAGTTSALDAFSSMLPSVAHVVNTDSPADSSTRDVPLSSLKTGQTVLVKPGETIPADGVIVSGTVGVDESLLTGESLPVTRKPGQKVIAGSISTDSALRVRISATGTNTTLSTIQRLVDEAQGSKTSTQLLADRAAALLFWYALLAGAAAFLVWMLVGAGWTVALERLITVLVIACPHALGLAIPLVVSISMGDAAAHGTLFSKRSALETLATVKTVAFDKTGTLTLGSPAVESIDVRSGSAFSQQDILRLASSAENDSEHPLARAIVRQARHDNVALSAATDFVATPGLGVTAHVDGHEIAIGGPALLHSYSHKADSAPTASLTPSSAPLSVPAELATAHNGEADADTRLWVIVDAKVEALIRLADQIRPESAAAIHSLSALGIRTVMITGDAQPVADSVARKLGISTVFAGVKPGEKSAIIEKLQKDGPTAMVGDGVNDAPALARADVGIAIGAGTDVAAGSSDIVLAGSDPRQIARNIQLSRLTVRKMHQNLWWAAGYNLIAVPLAAGILAWPPINFMMPMSVGAALMALSTVIVVLNANLLKGQLAKLRD